MTKFTTETLDLILQLQFRVAWAGEALSEPPRLKWWRTNLTDEMGGGDFMKRLAPRTHRWAAFQAVREAARITDEKARQRLGDPDSTRTLFFWGFELDEQLSDRLRERKWGQDPEHGEVQPDCPEQGEFVPAQLQQEFKALAPDAAYQIQSSGRQLKGEMPTSPQLAARMLVAALTPFAPDYPVPFFRVTDEHKLAPQ
jgi:hypothetical protein